MKKSLSKAERLKRKADFNRVFNRGERTKGRKSSLVFVSNDREYNRFAVCPVRKYGNAVERNRAKRVCREAIRHIKDRLQIGYDLVVVLYPGRDTEERRRSEIELLCRRAGIWREKDAPGQASTSRSSHLPEKING